MHHSLIVCDIKREEVDGSDHSTSLPRYICAGAEDSELDYTALAAEIRAKHPSTATKIYTIHSPAE